MKRGTGSGKSGTRKYGRDKEKCQKYRMAGKREKNKIRTLEKLLIKAKRLEWNNVGQIRGAIDRTKQRVYDL